MSPSPLNLRALHSRLLLSNHVPQHIVTPPPQDTHTLPPTTRDTLIWCVPRSLNDPHFNSKHCGIRCTAFAAYTQFSPARARQRSSAACSKAAATPIPPAESWAPQSRTSSRFCNVRMAVRMVLTPLEPGLVSSRHMPAAFCWISLESHCTRPACRVMTQVYPPPPPSCWRRLNMGRLHVW